MAITRLLCALAILLPLAIAAPSAQTPSRESQLPIHITLTTESDLVRFATPGEALAWRLEVTTSQGEPTFDSGLVTGAALEWPLLEPRANPSRATSTATR